MIEINNILEVEKYIDNVDVIIFDLDDTLYNEKDYVYSGFKASCPNRYNELIKAFLDGEKPFDKVFGNEKDKYLEAYRKHFPEIELTKDVKEMLENLKSQKKKLGIITDGRVEGQKNKIKALKLEDYFEKIIITDELGGIEYRKPNPKAFELMSDYFMTHHEKMVYIGDNIEKDFNAPESLGMQTIYFKNEDSIKNLRNNNYGKI